MLKRVTIKLVIVLGLLLSSACVYAISKHTARFGTVCVAALSAGASFYCWHSIAEVQKMQPAVLVIPSLMITGAMHFILKSITPEGRLKRANVLLKKLLCHKLAKMSFDKKESFFDAIHDYYLQEDLPLMSSYKKFLQMLPDIHKAFDLLNKASADLKQDALLQKRYRDSLSCAKKIFKNISMALKRIRKHKDYLPQLKLYKDFLNSTKQTIAQEQMANAQLQMAHAQRGFVFLKWIKWIFRM